LSLTKPETLEYPAASIRDFAWVSVKLLDPAAGALEVFALGLATAGVLGWGFAAGAVFCAIAFGPSAVAPAKTAMTAVVESQFISQFLSCLGDAVVPTTLCTVGSPLAKTIRQSSQMRDAAERKVGAPMRFSHA
jgi:hypothetical protein